MLLPTFLMPFQRKGRLLILFNCSATRKVSLLKESFSAGQIVSGDGVFVMLLPRFVVSVL